jgi:hypothetical protein
MSNDLVKRLRAFELWKAESWHEHGKRHRSVTYLNALPGTIDEAADRIEELEAALNKILQKCPYSKRDKWCSNLDCNCVVARAALGETE